MPDPTTQKSRAAVYPVLLEFTIVIPGLILNFLILKETNNTTLHDQDENLVRNQLLQLHKVILITYKFLKIGPFLNLTLIAQSAGGRSKCSQLKKRPTNSFTAKRQRVKIMRHPVSKHWIQDASNLLMLVLLKAHPLKAKHELTVRLCLTMYYHQ